MFSSNYMLLWENILVDSGGVVFFQRIFKVLLLPLSFQVSH